MSDLTRGSQPLDQGDDVEEGALAVKDVSKSFEVNSRRRPVLSDVSMSVPAGNVVALVGPTGCGKTTLLRMIAGFESIDEGVITVGGAPVEGPGPDRGFVFQQANLFPWLNVHDNVAFSISHGRGRRLQGISKRDVEDRVRDYLQRVGLSNASELYPYQISGGMKARAALGRILTSNPPILLMDEPFGALDALTRASMHQLVLELMSSGDRRTIVLITHDVEEAALLSDTIYVMSKGPAHIAAEFTVPFGKDRHYKSMLRSAELSSLKADVLDTLQPYLS